MVNYNTTDYLRDCLNSVEKYLDNISYEIIVVDNDSPDREIEKLPDEFKNVKFILRDTNDGFGCGCNFGVGASKGKYLLFLNPDIKMFDNSILKLLKYLESNPDTGIVSGLMVDENKSVIYSFNEYPSYVWEIYQLLGFGYDRKIKQLVNKNEIEKSIIFETDWFHGAIFMIRKDDFLKNGGFNENYFMYYEDVEICFDTKIKNHKKVVCIPSVKVFHHTQSSLDSESSDNIFIFHIHRGKLIFIKNYPVFKRSVLRLLGIVYVISRIVILPFWSKYKNKKKEKFYQLLKVLKLYMSKTYVYGSKYEYIK